MNRRCRHSPQGWARQLEHEEHRNLRLPFFLRWEAAPCNVGLLSGCGCSMVVPSIGHEDPSRSASPDASAITTSPAAPAMMSLELVRLVLLVRLVQLPGPSLPIPTLLVAPVVAGLPTAGPGPNQNTMGQVADAKAAATEKESSRVSE